MRVLVINTTFFHVIGQVGNLKNIYHFGMGSERMSPMFKNEGVVYTEQLQSDPNVSGFRKYNILVAFGVHPLGPAYSLPDYFYPAAYKLSTCFDHHSILYRI